MRIHRLEMENFKRVKVVSIDPDANTVVIGGRNAQGKSSVLDGIMAALAGRAGAKELVEPIRHGEKKARVVLELDDLRVERKWTPSGSTLTVGPRDGGSKFNSPQQVLDKLIGTLAFDPLAFALADEKKQVETLIDIIGRAPFEALAAERRAAYEDRTDINRALKGAERTLEHFVAQLPDARPAELVEVDVSKLSIELEGAIELERARSEYENIENEITALRERQARIAALAKEVVARVNPRPSETVRAEIQGADAHNAAVRQFSQVDDLRGQVAQLAASSEERTELIQDVDQQKAEMIANASLPVEGLGFDEDGVTLNGIPFKQASAAERLKVSVAMAMAMNPDLRVICIRDASLLDSDSRQALVEMATAHDYQIWYEVVGDPGQIGVLLEDGEVVDS